MAEFSKSVIAACQQGLDYTTRQMALLFVVGRSKKPLRFGEAAIGLGISKPAVTRAADRLASVGYLNRLQVAGDGRTVDLVLTASGKAFMERAQGGFQTGNAKAA